MATRTALRRLVLLGLIVALPAVGTAPLAASTSGAADDRAPTRAVPSRVVPAHAGTHRLGPGYHHLGATSSGNWSGVGGRVTVRDPAVRPDTHDFVATRLMAKRSTAGRTSWLEAGWAETGWSGGGRQRIYTFDTRRNAWTFYDQYPLAAGDQISLYVHTESTVEPAVWQAWLWWRGGWHLLTSVELPLGIAAQVEQYVEVYVDPRAGGAGFAVPPVSVDNVRVKPSPTGGPRPWGADVPTTSGTGRGRYCLAWRTRFDAWQAGDCAAAPPS